MLMALQRLAISTGPAMHTYLTAFTLAGMRWMAIKEIGTVRWFRGPA